jgi:protein TonB
MEPDAQNILSTTASLSPSLPNITSPRPPSAPEASRHRGAVTALVTALALTHCVTPEPTATQATATQATAPALHPGGGATALFARRVRAKVRIALSLPAAYRGRGLVTQLGLRIAGDGALRDVVVVRGSGDSGYDAMLLDAARRAAPFPEPPAEVLANDGLVTIPFEAS